MRGPRTPVGSQGPACAHAAPVQVNYLIERAPSGKRSGFRVRGTKKAFDTLSQLVEYYSAERRPALGIQLVPSDPEDFLHLDSSDSSDDAGNGTGAGDDDSSTLSESSDEGNGAGAGGGVGVSPAAPAGVTRQDVERWAANARREEETFQRSLGRSTKGGKTRSSVASVQAAQPRKASLYPDELKHKHKHKKHQHQQQREPQQRQQRRPKPDAPAAAPIPLATARLPSPMSSFSNGHASMVGPGLASQPYPYSAMPPQAYAMPPQAYAMPAPLSPTGAMGLLSLGSNATETQIRCAGLPFSCCRASSPPLNSPCGDAADARHGMQGGGGAFGHDARRS